ncbi:hypothetical protein [Actinoplanes sp. RD1]|uniref:hypothetical protein n=1 Tax=Actinoplanes sp. RD1 TaxID=3064538 RepID=UPI0027417912|nr:hypothetical protein [Actinoplanes sp. RD1]
MRTDRLRLPLRVLLSAAGGAAVGLVTWGIARLVVHGVAAAHHNELDGMELGFYAIGIPLLVVPPLLWGVLRTLRVRAAGLIAGLGLAAYAVAFHISASVDYTSPFSSLFLTSSLVYAAYAGSAAALSGALGGPRRAGGQVA